MAGTLAIYISPLDLETFEALDLRITLPAELPPYARDKTYNRYYDILPNPLTMVRLADDGTGEESTYINANYVRGYGSAASAREYIAAQGPTLHTLPAFVRLLWEKGVHVLVMATDLVEGGRPKCERYWPATPGDAPLVFGAFSVKLTRVEPCDGYEINHLELSHGAETRELRHFWLNEWPDHGVPENPDGTMNVSYVVQV